MTGEPFVVVTAMISVRGFALPVRAARTSPRLHDEHLPREQPAAAHAVEPQQSRDGRPVVQRDVAEGLALHDNVRDGRSARGSSPLLHRGIGNIERAGVSVRSLTWYNRSLKPT